MFEKIDYSKLERTIDERLQQFALQEGVSIIDLHIMYHHQIVEVSNIYRIPQEHHSKVLAIAFNQAKAKVYTVKEE